MLIEESPMAWPALSVPPIGLTVIAMMRRVSSDRVSAFVRIRLSVDGPNRRTPKAALPLCAGPGSRIDARVIQRSFAVGPARSDAAAVL
jgi:hypothetical protein